MEAYDPGRTRAYNPRLRWPMPYPLGHRTSCGADLNLLSLFPAILNVVGAGLLEDVSVFLVVRKDSIFTDLHCTAPKFVFQSRSSMTTPL